MIFTEELLNGKLHFLCLKNWTSYKTFKFWNKYYKEGNFFLVFLLFDVNNYIFVFAVLLFSFFSWKSRIFIRWCKLNASLNYDVMYWYSPQVLYIFLVCLHKKFLPKIFLLNANPRNFVTICNVGKWFECFWSTWGYKPYWYKRKDILKTLWNYLRWNFLAKIVSAF